MSNKNIEVCAGWDNSGRWRLTINKKRGRLTLDEVRQVAREFEWDYYLLVIDAFHDDFDEQFGDSPPPGDYAILYRTDLFYEEGEH